MEKCLRSFICEYCKLENIDFATDGTDFYTSLLIEMGFLQHAAKKEKKHVCRVSLSCEFVVLSFDRHRTAVCVARSLYGTQYNDCGHAY